MTKRKGKKGSGVPERDLFWDSSDEQEYAKEQDSSDCVMELDHSEINLKPAARKNTTKVQKPRFQSNNSSETEKESNVTMWQRNPTAQKTKQHHSRYGQNPQIWTILCPIKNLLQKTSFQKAQQSTSICVGTYWTNLSDKAENFYKDAKYLVILPPGTAERLN
jgi:hypothetical protein